MPQRQRNKKALSAESSDTVPIAVADQTNSSTSSGKPSKPTLSRSQSSGSAGSSHRRSSSSSNSGGKGKKCALGTSTVEYLKVWMMSPEHVEHPYPTEEEKARIMNDTGIELKQLTNWFVNNRKRYWKPRVEELRKNGGLASESSNASANGSDDNKGATSCQAKTASANGSTNVGSSTVSSSEEDEVATATSRNNKRRRSSSAPKPNKRKSLPAVSGNDSESSSAANTPTASPKRTYIATTPGGVGALQHSDGIGRNLLPHPHETIVSPHSVIPPSAAAAACAPYLRWGQLTLLGGPLLPSVASTADSIYPPTNVGSTHSLLKATTPPLLAPPPLVGADFAHSCNDWSCTSTDPLRSKMEMHHQPCALCSACRDWNLGEFSPWELTLIGDTSADDDADTTNSGKGVTRIAGFGNVRGVSFSADDDFNGKGTNNTTGSTDSSASLTSYLSSARLVSEGSVEIGRSVGSVEIGSCSAPSSSSMSSFNSSLSLVGAGGMTGWGPWPVETTSTSTSLSSPWK